MERVILHSDLNNFYASVECRDNPELRGRPVAVCGDPEARHGIVLAKSQEAKRMVVATGQAIWQAREKCRDLIVVPPHYDRYLEFSAATQDIYVSYTDRVEPFGLDECWLDVGGSAGLFGPGEAIANDIRSRIKRELGLTASVGVSFNKVFAKLGSDYQKPDATIIPGQIRNNLDFRVCGRADSVLSQIILDTTSAADQIPKDARGRFLLHDGTVFQGYLFDEERL